jgi:uncharacterized protein YjbJ (UPF0337 family)
MKRSCSRGRTVGPEAGLRSVAEDITGKAKEAAGAVTDNDSLQAEGRAQQDKADAQREIAANETEAEKAHGKAAAAEAEERAPPTTFYPDTSRRCRSRGVRRLWSRGQSTSPLASEATRSPRRRAKAAAQARPMPRSQRSPPQSASYPTAGLCVPRPSRALTSSGLKGARHTQCFRF